MTNREAILQYLREHSRGTSREIADATGRRKASLHTMLCLMVECGTLARLGTVKQGQLKPEIDFSIAKVQVDRKPKSRGVRTVDDLKDRCRIDDDTGCWRYCGGSGGLWLPALRRTGGLGVAICVLLTGAAPAEGAVWHCTCTTKRCANPSHRKAGNRSSQMVAARIERDAQVCARIAAGKRAVSKLSDAAADDIRRSSEALRVIAARHGISISHAQRIRVGKLRRALVRGASVFHLGSGS